jgi:hypothetical protein
MQKFLENKLILNKENYHELLLCLEWLGFATENNYQSVTQIINRHSEGKIEITLKNQSERDYLHNYIAING